MLFNSVNYVVFLPIVIMIYFLLPEYHTKTKKKDINKNRYKNFFLLICSYFFYMCWIPKYVILMMVSTIVTYIIAIIIDKLGNVRQRKVALFMSIIINFGILFIFKYYNFFIDSVGIILSKIGMSINLNKFNLLLPVGISFYIFQAIGYAIDVYRNDIKPEHNFINYALFVSFFPQLVAGPIERAKNLLPQFREGHKFHDRQAVDGMKIILIGLFKKVVISDTIAIYVDAVFNQVTRYSGITLIIAIILFSIQIYCDFSGYSDIAIGSAKILGFRLMENFKAPYFSSSIGEFWNRWHISLNTWFKDYIYIPLGGSKKGKLRKYGNLMAIFLLSGLWHGANWTFVVWGLLNGFYRVCQEWIRNFELPVVFHSQILHRIKEMIKRLFTYGLVCFSWMFFRANSIADAKYVIFNLFKNINIYNFFNHLYSIINTNLLDLKNMRYFYIIIVIVSLTFLLIVDYKKNRSQSKSYDEIIFQSKYTMIRWIEYIILTILIIFLFLLQNGIYGQTGQFIYFQF